MTPRTWAERAIEKAQRSKSPDDTFARLPAESVIALMQAEHARSVRIVERALNDIENGVPPADRSGYVVACTHILAALQQGRGKGGKG